MTGTFDDIQRRLIDERRELVQQLEDMGFDPNTGSPKDVDFEHGFADSGAATAEKANLLSLAEALMATLQEVDAALRAIDDGTYGVCTNCAKEIPIERLEARPQSRLCVTCKQAAGG
ncbi:MAG TPA: TraR/DksA C4-type zinc finger protein [Actinomycetota bacterium]|nr:TraR/DksA C4-type zinc finger protein [Actinomycetota bacterium]